VQCHLAREISAQRAVVTSKLSLPARFAIIAAILALEKVLLSLVVDYTGAQATHGLGELVRAAQASGFRFAVAFTVALALFAYVRGGNSWSSAIFPEPDTSIRPRWFVAHLLLAAPLVPIAFYLYRDQGARLPFAALMALSVLFVTAALIALFGAMASWTIWLRTARALGVLWLYAGIAALAGTWAMPWSKSLWPPTARLTFDLVGRLLHPLIPTLTTDPAKLILHTDRFSIYVSPDCSGLEGVGLMLMFCCAWLLLFRSEYRFPRALLLIPAGLALVFALNVVRIAVLMLIGYNGYPGVAIYGFHSQAGWIAFNGSAVALALLSRRSRWLCRTGLGRSEGENPTAAYLMPFLAILATGILVRAASAGFEYLYPFRLVCCIAALLWFRKGLRGLDWHMSWRGPAAGCAVFALWLLAAGFLLRPGSMPAELGAMSPLLRTAWIFSRVTAAVVTVPIAEELAYRGYLLRRWLGPEFESLPFAAVRWPALALTSVIFGLSHGPMWAAGIAAGWVYGALAIRTGRIGECVAAHATTNALLAALVLLDGQWQLW
jgi:exosortase E/protease (VPEID-CTERM system)